MRLSNPAVCACDFVSDDQIIILEMTINLTHSDDYSTNMYFSKLLTLHLCNQHFLCLSILPPSVVVVHGYSDLCLRNLDRAL